MSRRRFQLHLLTVCLLLVVAAVLLGLNIRPRGAYFCSRDYSAADGFPKPTGYAWCRGLGWPLVFAYTQPTKYTEQPSSSGTPARHADGTPVQAEDELPWANASIAAPQWVRTGLSSPWHRGRLAANAGLALVLLAVVGLITERALRARERRRRDSQISTI